MQQRSETRQSVTKTDPRLSPGGSITVKEADNYFSRTFTRSYSGQAADYRTYNRPP
ncbi:MAG: hypothetical protein OXM01_11740 [Gemmatimonadota bacterium]|nr:hypothetical protein [Gemmatimonadota bacterium]